MSTPFCPYPDATVNIAVSSSSQSVLVFAGAGEHQVRIFNDGTVTSRVKLSKDPAVTASMTVNVPIGPGVTEVWTSDGPIYAAAIASGTGSTVSFTPGSGE